MTSQENKTPDWLTKIQNNSWEPEIIISGFSIAFFFLLPKYIYNFTAMLIQDLGANVILSTVQYGLMTFIVTSLQVLFTGHLVLRGLWAGLVGLSYVFPNGVRKENLKKELRDSDFKKPIDLVIEVEKVCSLIFSFAFTIILFLINIIALYSILIICFMLLYNFNLDTQMTRIVQVALVLCLSAIFVWFQRSRSKKPGLNGSQSLVNNLLNTFTTNIPKKTQILLLLGFAMLVVPLSYSNINKFKFDANDVTKKPKTGLVSINQNNYLDKKSDELRIQRAALNSYDVTNSDLELYISTYKSDRILLREITNNPDKFAIIRPDVDIESVDQTALYRVYIDDQPINNDEWLLTKNSSYKQELLTTYISTESLFPGLHTLEIKRVKWDKKAKDFVLIDDWMRIPFNVVSHK